MLRSKPFQSRAGARQGEPRPDRSSEFASYTPRARPAAPSTGLLALAADMAPPEPVDVLPPLTAAAVRHKGRIAAMRCVCCYLLGMEQQSHTEVHHIREGRIARNHFLTLPLCGEGCHRGPRGVHGDRTYLRQLQIGEFDLLAVTLEQLETTA